MSPDFIECKGCLSAFCAVQGECVLKPSAMTATNPSAPGWAVDIAERLAPKFGVEAVAIEIARLCVSRAEYDRVRQALEACFYELYAPAVNCSCHITPPCADCVDFGPIREALQLARQALELERPEHD